MTSPQVPARLPVPNGRQLTVQFLQGGQPSACVLGAHGEDVPLTKAIGQAWLDAFWAAFRPLLHNSLTVLGGTVRDVSQTSGDVFELAAPPSPTGPVTWQPAIAAAAFLIRWNTGQAGRRAKGRTFLPGMHNSHLDTNGRLVTAAAQADINTFAAAYLTNARAINGINPSVLSFSTASSFAINTGVCSSKAGLQTRRMVA